MFLRQASISTMLKLNLLTVLISASVLVKVSSLELYQRDFKDVDVFKVTEFDNPNSHIGGNQIQELNNFLVDRTDSTDPDENLDIVLEELTHDLKSGVSYESGSVRAKRLILALRTIQGDNLCSYYAIRILWKSIREIKTRVDNIFNEDENSRRLDKILAHFIREHLNKCQDVYLKNYDQIVSSLNDQLDTILMNRLNVILEEPMKFVTSEERYGNEHKTYIERIFDMVSTRHGVTSIDPVTPYIYNAMKELVKDDPNEKFIRPIEGEKKGEYRIVREEFEKLFNEYVAKPCNYIREKFGPDVFEPVEFRRIFDSRIIYSQRVDFYETWLKYKLCDWDLFGDTYRNTFYYAKSYFAKLEKQGEDIKTVQ